jgi:cytochrome c biogenesis protein CcmG, thiol:disulfide interchange protein DsbE
MVAVAVSLTTRDPRPGPEQQLGVFEVSGPLPDLSRYETPAGGGIDPAEYRGSVVVLNFWASWCAPCRREQPELSRVAAAHEDVAVIGVNYRDQEAAANAYLDEFDVAYPSLVDFAGTLLGELAVPGLPATIVAGPDGELRFKVLGEVEEELLEDLIARAREEGSG